MKFIHSIKKQYSSLKSKILYFAVVFIACVFISGLTSKTAHASIYSIVNSIFGGESVSAKINPLYPNSNSQTFAILQPAINFDPNPEKTADIIPVEAGGTLIPDLAVANSDTGNNNVNTQISTYIVQSGDTVSDISEMFGVSVNTIAWANGITKASSIRPGQTLVILPVSGIRHTVKSGDTISSIVEQYKANLEEFLEYNDLTLSSKLVVGQSLLLPDVEISTSIPTHIVNAASSGSNSNSSGYYIRPVPKYVVKSQGIHGYNGVDLAGPIGTPIYASAQGTVIVSRGDGQWNGGYGSFIIVSHPNGTQTLYAHLSKNLVKAGDYVEQGDKIALMGSTGKSTGSHLHFEIRGAKNPF